MRIPEKDSFKARIVNYSLKNNLRREVVYQNYIYERFLERLSKSKYANYLVIKGGALITYLVGMKDRSTTDIDLTLINNKLDEKIIYKMIKEIIGIKVNDGFVFEIESVKQIMLETSVKAYRVEIDVNYFTIIFHFSLDICEGNNPIPNPIKYEFGCILDDNKSISVYGYCVESILADKAVTFLEKGLSNTRMKDFYDIYTLTKKKHDRDAFILSFKEVYKSKRLNYSFDENKRLLNNIKNDITFNILSENYQKTNPYAKGITLLMCLTSIDELLRGILN